MNYMSDIYKHTKFMLNILFIFVYIIFFQRYPCTNTVSLWHGEFNKLQKRLYSLFNIENYLGLDVRKIRKSAQPKASIGELSTTNVKVDLPSAWPLDTLLKKHKDERKT